MTEYRVTGEEMVVDYDVSGDEHGAERGFAGHSGGGGGEAEASGGGGVGGRTVPVQIRCLRWNNRVDKHVK